MRGVYPCDFETQFLGVDFKDRIHYSVFMVLFFAVISFSLSGLISFLSFGLLWSGVNPWTQVLPTLLFLALSFFMTRVAKLKRDQIIILFAIILGAAPLATILAQVRNAEGAQGLGFSIIGSWAIVTVLGSRLAHRPKRPKV